MAFNDQEESIKCQSEMREKLADKLSLIEGQGGHQSYPEQAWLDLCRACALLWRTQ